MTYKCGLKEQYGNVLFDFCHYRLYLKEFYRKQLWIRKIHTLQNMVYVVSKSLTNNESFPSATEFYREYI